MADLSQVSTEDLQAYKQGRLGDVSTEGLMAIRDAVKPKADPEKQIDRKTGAPIRVRAAVGAAITPEDRLTTIKKFYPDAEPYDRNNFVYTNPKTGQQTLYNEENSKVLGVKVPSAGDIVSAGPEAAEFIGGTLGGVGGTIAAPFTGPAAPAMPYLGIGAGATGGRETYNALAEALLGTEDTRSKGQKVGDMAVTFGGNAAGAKIGDMVVDAGRGLFGLRRAVRGKPNSQMQDIVEAGQKSGVDLPAAAVTGNRNTEIMENALMNLPGSSDVMASKYAAAEGQLARQAGKIAQDFAGGKKPMTMQGAGGEAAKSAKNASERFTARQEDLYNKAYDLIGSDTRMNVPAIQDLKKQIIEELAKAPETLKPQAKKTLDLIDNLLTDEKDGGIAFSAVRQIRSNIGKDINDPMLAGSSGVDNEYLKRVYKALSDDIYGLADETSPEAARALKVADRYTRYNMTQNIPVLQKLVDQGADEKAFRFAMQSAKDGGSRLYSLRRNFRPEEWDVVAGTVFDNLGRARPSAQGATGLFDEAGDWSVDTFMTNWNKLSPEARKALFGGTQYKELRRSLDYFLKSSSAMKEAMRGRNFSNTAKNLAPAIAAYSALGYVSSGDPEGAAKFAAGAILAPRFAAKLMTNPRFVRWLAEAPKAAGRNAWGQHIGRLSAIGDANPDMRDAINSYISNLQQNPAPGAGTELDRQGR
ncbi:MAG: hypothetical protein GC149_20325 [Gammaproteobacteria bacterium]|nr:hypothetical protein [Gammaproteobacteria bacterium]